MNKSVPAKRGDIFYISNSKCYATDPSNTEGRPAIVVSSDKLNEHADVVEVVYLTTKEKRLMLSSSTISEGKKPGVIRRFISRFERLTNSQGKHPQRQRWERSRSTIIDI